MISDLSPAILKFSFFVRNMIDHLGSLKNPVFYNSGKLPQPPEIQAGGGCSQEAIGERLLGGEEGKAPQGVPH